MQNIKLRTFIMLSVAFHVLVISAIVLYFLKNPPSGGRSGTVMVGLISGHDNGQGKASTSEAVTKFSSAPKEISKSKVALQKKPANKTVKRNTKNKIQKETLRTIKKEQKPTQKSKQVSTSKVIKENKAGKGIETASIVTDGNFGSLDDQATGLDGTKTELAYPAYNLNPKPNYPRSARKRGYEGEVKLKVLVLENGKVGKIVVAQIGRAHV
jgi:outer membrane biosynthesis protein TonB